MSIDAQQLAATGPQFEAWRYNSEWWWADAHGVWRARNDKDLRRELLYAGYKGKRGTDESNSGVDEWIRQRSNTHSVDYVGPVAGFDAGVHTICRAKWIVSVGVQVLEAKKGDWSMLETVITGMLEKTQTQYFYSWMAIGLKALRARKQMPGQMLILVGEAGSAKSLIQKMITGILGGRVANPWRYMTEKTPFNKDLIGAEHLCIEDQAGKITAQERRTLGDYAKQFAINMEQSCHAKGRDAITVTPFHRITMSLNDCPENILALPQMDPGILDKLIIFLCQKNDMPMDTSDHDKRDIFTAALTALLPAFMYFLEHEYVIPAHIQGGRCGMQAFHHPKIVDTLNEGSQELKLQALLDTLLGQETKPWVGKASELESRLLFDEDTSFQAKTMIAGHVATGLLLGKLARIYPDQVRKSSSYTRTKQWIITPTHLLPTSPAPSPLVSTIPGSYL